MKLVHPEQFSKVHSVIISIPAIIRNPRFLKVLHILSSDVSQNKAIIVGFSYIFICL